MLPVIPPDELIGYVRKLKESPYEGDIKRPAKEYELFWNIARHICRSDLWFLNKHILIHPKRDRTYEPLHRDMCDFYMRERARDKLIIIPRKHFKSTLITVGATIMEILKNPNISILIANKIHGMAVSFLSEIKEQMETNARLRALFPDIIPQNPAREVSKWSQEEIRVLRTAIRKDSTVKTIGMDGGKTGAAHDLEILDDILDDETVNSRELMAKTRRFVEMVQFLLNPGGTITYIGTRYGFNDLYAGIIEQIKNGRNMAMYIRRALEGPNVSRCVELLEGRQAEVGDEEDDAIDMTEEVFRDQAIFPCNDRTGAVEFSPAILRSRYLEGAGTQKESEVAFWNQMLNFPVEPKTQVFKRGNTKFINTLPTNREFYRYVICDPSLGETDSSDYCVIINLFVDFDGRWIVGPDIVRERIPPDQIEDELLRYSLMTPPPRAVGVESEAYQDTLRQGLIRKLKAQNLDRQINVHPLVSHKRAKSLRILQIQPKHRAGLIYFPDTALMHEILDEEVYRWRPQGKNQLDDFLDALSYGNQMTLNFGLPPAPDKRKWLADYHNRTKKRSIEQYAVDYESIGRLLDRGDNIL